VKFSYLIFSVTAIFLVKPVLSADWESFKAKFMRNNEYIVDPYNNYRVTSEAQGYGMLIAVLNNDKGTFEKMLNWTINNLQREDKLFSWHWNGGKVIDKNNALDGDLFIAYSLLIAYKSWKDEKYNSLFNQILPAIKQHILPILWEKNESILLIPAKYGYIHENEGTITLMPSYYIPFIFNEFYNYTADEVWKKLYNYTLNRIYSIRDIPFSIGYSLFSKNIYKATNYVDIDTYRIILYAYLDENIYIIRGSGTFQKVIEFYKKEGYIPIKFLFDGTPQTKENSPYCVYRWFYFIYNDKKLLEIYEKNKEVDKNNYYCEALELIEKGLKRGK